MSKIPATVITGFLGAGKTTLIRHLISNAQGRRIALIVNEFGDVGVDGELLKGCGDETCRDEDIIELANGCICCTVADDFVPTMEKLLDRPNPPEHIVIETSGLALPQPLVRAFRWPEVKTRVTVDGVITVIDAAAVAAGRFAEDEAALAAQRRADPALDHDQPIAELFEDQIGCADLIILNKTDLVDAETLTRVEAQVRAEARPAAGLVHADHGKLPAAVLLGLTAATEGDIDNRPSHHDLEGEEHDHDDFESFVVETGAQSDQGLSARIAAIMARHDILRLKGFVAVPGKDMRLVVQAVGPRVESFFDRAWAAGEERRTRLVVIGEKGLDQSAISQALAA
ncbi:MAG: cobalamin biosynthesis protein CobW [Ferrovibrionaceae bacterium]